MQQLSLDRTTARGDSVAKIRGGYLGFYCDGAQKGARAQDNFYCKPRPCGEISLLAEGYYNYFRLKCVRTQDNFFKDEI